MFGYWGEKRRSACTRNSSRRRWTSGSKRTQDQQTLWNPTMELGDNFYNLIQVTNMPFNMHHVVRLQRSPRRMDLYLFLCHRTPRIPQGKPVNIPLATLQRIFAPDIESAWHFKERLRTDLKAKSRKCTRASEWNSKAICYSSGDPHRPSRQCRQSPSLKKNAKSLKNTTC